MMGLCKFYNGDIDGDFDGGFDGDFDGDFDRFWWGFRKVLMGFMSFECRFGLGCMYCKVNKGYLFSYRF